MNDDGSTGAVISDSNGILFIGSGVTKKDGTFNVLASPLPNTGASSMPVQQVSIAATFYEEGFAATLAGAINQSVGGSQFHEPSTTCPYQSKLSGAFDGDDSGTLSLTVNPHGSTFGSTHHDGGDFSVDGTVDNDGSVSWHAGDVDGGLTMTGYIFLLPGQSVINGSGTWTAQNGDSGTWSCTGNIIFG